MYAAQAHCVLSVQIRRFNGDSAAHPSMQRPRHERRTVSDAARMCDGSCAPAKNMAALSPTQTKAQQRACASRRACAGVQFVAERADALPTAVDDNDGAVGWRQEASR